MGSKSWIGCSKGVRMGTNGSVDKGPNGFGKTCRIRFEERAPFFASTSALSFQVSPLCARTCSKDMFILEEICSKRLCI